MEKLDDSFQPLAQAESKDLSLKVPEKANDTPHGFSSKATKTQFKYELEAFEDEEEEEAHVPLCRRMLESCCSCCKPQNKALLEKEQREEYR